MWALDLGTTNTLLARWDPVDDRPAIVALDTVCRTAAVGDPTGSGRAIPSAVQAIERPGWLARLTQSRAVARHATWGKLADIGRPALERNRAGAHPGFAPTFKEALSQRPLAALTRTRARTYSARDVARLYLRELFAHAHRHTGQRVRDLVVTAPVEAFETYRAEVGALAKGLGVRRVRFLDEPVAAALGYGLGIAKARSVLLVDFGGGTLDLARVTLDGTTCTVLAKAGRALGGDTVDGWLLEAVCQRQGYALDDPESDAHRLWLRLMRAEAQRVKEALYFEPTATFDLTPPERLRHLEARLQGEAEPATLRRDDLIQLLAAHRLDDEIAACVDQVMGDAQVDDVLLVGGSTLLPGVYPSFEARFGRDRVRAWQPFEAVAFGAAVFAADRAAPADFIVHDYALLTYDAATGAPEHTVVVPRGTRFPTGPAFWTRKLVPTCARGEPESVFKLVICELGAADAAAVTWDANGQAHLGADGAQVVELNAANPTLGQLNPPHAPRDSTPRLEISLGVNAERWLCATVLDLRTKRSLMRDTPVVRLL